MKVVCAVMIEGGKVFVCRRPLEKDEGGKWEFPGGKVEPGEGDEDALAREITEELGMQISVGKRLGSAKREGLELIAYLCKRVAGGWELREHLEAKWVEEEEGDQLDWAALDVPLWAAVRARV
ncbi:(deoxy)nucleoside triphosphate pyrophosphohydrolase [Verrucomicrobiaceae bacterium 227]